MEHRWKLPLYKCFQNKEFMKVIKAISVSYNEINFKILEHFRKDFWIGFKVNRGTVRPNGLSFLEFGEWFALRIGLSPFKPISF